MAAVELMVIDVETRARGMPSKSVSMSSSESDGHADLAHFAARARVIGVEAHLRGQVEGHRKPVCPFASR
jgi:hypothetical protein